MAWAVAQDVLDRWVGPGQPTATTAQINKLIGDAEAYLATKYPDLSDEVSDDVNLQANVVRVVAQMVLRKLRNPQGLRQQQETTGPFSRGHTFAGEAPGELWHLTDEERLLIGDHTAQDTSQAFTVPMGGLY